MDDSLVDVARQALRSPLTDLRLVLHDPDAYWPILTLGGLLTLAWFERVYRWDERRREQLQWLGLAVGGAAVVWFIRAGQVAWDHSPDWQHSWTYYSALKQAVIEGRMPYQLRTAVQGTERYFANLEAPIVPHAPLLLWTPVSLFLTLNLLIHFTAGFRGLRKLQDALRLSPFAAFAFMTVFLLNGHVAGHLYAGHTQWASYYLIPWILVALVRMLQGRDGIESAAILALTLAAMIAGGGWHVFVWCFMFTAALCMTSLRRAKFLLLTSAMAALLAAIRLVPGILTFGAGQNTFLTGFESAPILVKALIAGPGNDTALLHWYEIDTFVGLVGFAVIAVGAIWRPDPGRDVARALLFPSAVLAVLSLDHVFGWTFFYLPGLVSQRVTTRFLIVPVLALFVIGCVRLDSLRTWQRGPRGLANLAMLLGSWVMVIQLSLRGAHWRPAAGTDGGLPTDVVKLAADDSTYLWCVWVGTVVSLATLLVLSVILARPRRPGIALAD
jgi:hypothetical protein